MTQLAQEAGGSGAAHPPALAPPLLQVGLAQMLKGGVIMDVTNAEEARIAEEAGAVAVMALERVPADIRRDGGVARMSDPTMIKAIKVRARRRMRTGAFGTRASQLPDLQAAPQPHSAAHGSHCSAGDAHAVHCTGRAACTCTRFPAA